MPMRKLKLPDGGTMNLSVPEGFGSAELGLTQASKATMYVAGAAFGAIAGFLIVYLVNMIGEAIEAR